MCKVKRVAWWWMVGAFVTLQLNVSWFEFEMRPFCEEFEGSPCACVGFCQVFPFPSAVQRHRLKVNW